MSKFNKVVQIIHTIFISIFISCINIRKGVLDISPLTKISSGVAFQFVKKDLKGSIRISKNSRILGRCLLRASGSGIIIGEHCEIRDSNIQANGGEIMIGKDTFINSGCVITSCERIEIGEGCALGTNISIYDQDHIFVREGKQPWNETKTSPIVIGNNCWIGANALILRGTEIGDNCVIAGGTIVKGKIPSHSLVKNNRELIITEIR